MMKIRRAKSADAAAIASLAGQLGYPTTADQIGSRLAGVSRSRAHVVFVAEHEGVGVVGWIHLLRRRLLIAREAVEIGGLVVDERHRGKGIGRSLMQAAEQWARSRGYAGLVARSDVRRQGAHGFYRALGYDPVKTQHVYRRRFCG